MKSVGFTWRGPSVATRKDFHDNTLRDAIAEGDRSIVAAGGKVEDYEFNGTTWF